MNFSKFHEFVPKSYLYLRNRYSWSIFKKDLLAGITVGIIALPLAMAFAIASGVSPEKGIYTAIIAGFLISALGGSRIQIGGPTGAFVVIISAIVTRTGYEGLCLSMLIAGFILLLLGFFRVGSWIKYVPAPLVTGFTTGIALIIFSTQIKDFFGLSIENPSADFLGKCREYYHCFSSFDPITSVFGVSILVFILLVRRLNRRIPWGISSIILSLIICSFIDLPLETIESRFGQLPRSLPVPSFPMISIPLDRWKEVLMDGISIAFLGAIESLLSAVIGDGMIGGRHRSNCELVAQGLANLGSVVFGGIPATGAIARTAANVKTGAQTPMSGMIHSVSLLLILCLFSPIVSKIPLVSLSAILLMVSWDMSEISHFIRLLRAPLGDCILVLIAFTFTVFVDITAAIFIGMVWASFLFMKTMSQTSKAVCLSKAFQQVEVDKPEENDPNDLSKKVIGKEIEVYEIQGPFFFGAANILRDLLTEIFEKPRVFILRLRFVPLIDASGMYGVEEFSKQCQKQGILFFITEIQENVKKDLKKFRLLDSLGRERIFETLDDALTYANELTRSKSG